MTPSQSSALRFGAPLLTLLSAIIVGQFLGFELALLLVAAAAFVLVIWMLWSSIQSLTGEAELSFEEALSLGAPSAEEEQKRAVLRALKDLDFERSLGKISPEDYTEYSARYREQAKRLMQSLDESFGAEKARVEKLVQERLAEEGLLAEKAKAEAAEAAKSAAPKEVDSEAAAEAKAPESETPPSDEKGGAEAESKKPNVLQKRSCPNCQADNELDARFCKRCGSTLAKDDEQLCASCPARYSKDLKACPDCGAVPEQA